MFTKLLNYINQQSNLYIQKTNNQYQITPRFDLDDYTDVKSDEFSHMLYSIPPYYGDISKVKASLAEQIEAMKDNIESELYETTLFLVEELIPVSFIENAINDSVFNNAFHESYPDSDNLSVVDKHQLVIDAIMSIYTDADAVNNIMNGIKIPSAINIGNKEMFNTEWGETGDFLLNEEPDDVEPYQIDSANAVAQLLHATNYPVTAVADALFNDQSLYKSDLFIQSIINHLSNAYNNVALLIPINVSLTDLLAYTQYDGPLTLPKDIKNLGFHCYLFGAGSIGIDDGIQLPYDIKIDSEQWSIVPDNIYQYSVANTVGSDMYNDESIKTYMVDKEIIQQTTL